MYIINKEKDKDKDKNKNESKMVKFRINNHEIPVPAPPGWGLICYPNSRDVPKLQHTTTTSTTTSTISTVSRTYNVHTRSYSTCIIIGGITFYLLVGLYIISLVVMIRDTMYLSTVQSTDLHCSL